MRFPFNKRRMKNIFSKGEKRNKPLPREVLLQSLIDKYGTNKEYTAHYLDHLLSHYKENPLYELYMEAELGSLKHGRELTTFLCQHFGNDHLFLNKECVDIGSSAGNLLIALVEQGAARAFGIEICEGRYQTALINMNGCLPEIKSKIHMVRDSIENEEITRIGQFDIILCTDVLEHVQDPPQAIKQICRLLKDDPDAFAYIRLRNFQHPQVVIHEPHYDLPAMVLLPAELSQPYYEACKPSDPIDFEALHWLSFYDYQALFKSFGKRLTFLGNIHPEPSCIDNVKNETQELTKAFDAFSERHHLVADLRKEIHRYINDYQSRMDSLIREYRSTGDRRLLETFYLNYVVWDIMMLITNGD